MVLQNKYKARASRRYVATRSGSSEGAESSRGRGGRGAARGGTGSRGRGGRGRGGGDGENVRWSRFDEGEEDGGSGGGEEEELDDEQEVELNPAFPSLKNGLRHTSHNAEHVTKTAAHQTADGEQTTGGIPSHQSTGLEASATEEASDSEEPEVDISNLLARVSALGEDAPVQGFAAGDRRADGNVTGQDSEDVDVQKDTDQSLAYLHARQQTRDARTRSAMKRADESFRKDRASGVDTEMPAEERERRRKEEEEMLKEREKAEAVTCESF
ncbi:hypothetical protein IE81DRAFT_199119 [Ceraceosorus guamensis]|uniref:Uncharacterized protein n=1 Tax=Ceraceosorus guamensis TaxID=1522189 RepID=A0A316VX09_9BASI|nr:hypothetical protein IE81DRAFT_199119 [Ceraceosorus guamensis]PWN40983.1 hypothetical protein IE81DRAFT_199119 [Ceraceosorus guamensis]